MPQKAPGMSAQESPGVYHSKDNDSLIYRWIFTKPWVWYFLHRQTDGPTDKGKLRSYSPGA